MEKNLQKKLSELNTVETQTHYAHANIQAYRHAHTSTHNKNPIQTTLTKDTQTK